MSFAKVETRCITYTIPNDFPQSENEMNNLYKS